MRILEGKGHAEMIIRFFLLSFLLEERGLCQKEVPIVCEELSWPLYSIWLNPNKSLWIISNIYWAFWALYSHLNMISCSILTIPYNTSTIIILILLMHKLRLWHVLQSAQNHKAHLELLDEGSTCQSSDSIVTLFGVHHAGMVFHPGICLMWWLQWHEVRGHMTTFRDVRFKKFRTHTPKTLFLY